MSDEESVSGQKALLEQYPDLYQRLVFWALDQLYCTADYPTMIKVFDKGLTGSQVKELYELMRDLVKEAEKPLYIEVNKGRTMMADSGPSYPVPGEEPCAYTHLSDAVISANWDRWEYKNDQIGVGIFLMLPGLSLLDPATETICDECTEVVKKADCDDNICKPCHERLGS